MKFFSISLAILLPLFVAAAARSAEVEHSAASDAPSKNSPDEAKPQADSATYHLQYRFQPGQVMKSKVVQLATIETMISGSSQTTQMSTMAIRVWKINGVDADGLITFEHSVESVDMRTQMSGHDEVHFNSLTDKKAPPGYEDVAKSLGRPLAICTINPAGKIVKREDKYHQPVAENSGQQLLVPLPEEAVAIGHVWSQPQDVNVSVSGGQTKKIKTRDRYELEKVEHGIATISVETQVLTPTSDPKIQVQLMQRLRKGSLRFDIAAGQIVGERTELDERVLGFSGADSSMHYVARFTEETLSAEPKTASLPKP